MWSVFGQKYLCPLNLQDGAFDTSGWFNQSESEEEALTANYAKGYILGTYNLEIDFIEPNENDDEMMKKYLDVVYNFKQGFM